MSFENGNGNLLNVRTYVNIIYNVLKYIITNISGILIIKKNIDHIHRLGDPVFQKFKFKI